MISRGQNVFFLMHFSSTDRVMSICKVWGWNIIAYGIIEELLAHLSVKGALFLNASSLRFEMPRL